MPRKANHLDGEASPYLKQHRYNPVDWYPWGQEAFRRAVSENKLIFLSIGYSTCHWCHVMAEQSFENERVASALNEAFICVKVDREERPDLDAVYMRFCQMLNGNGGWPLNVVLTPDLKPLTAATYIPPEYLREFAIRISSAWQEAPKKLQDNAETFTALLRKIPERRDSVFEQGIDKQAWNNLRKEFDAENGGFGGAPKFPSPHRLMFLLRYWYQSPSPEIMKVLETTLNKMRCGGIYDQVGGGFHRYSIDAAWKVPHFEKMLYDQAMLALLYTEAAAATGNSFYRQTAGEIIDYAMRRLKAPGGAFFAAEDAREDYYLWTWDELRQHLAPGEFSLAVKIYNCRPEGNFTPESGKNVRKANILHMSMPPTQLALKMQADPGFLLNMKKRLKVQLSALRARRPAPHVDDKIISGWNGLMIAALARAGRAFDQPSYLEAASAAAEALLSGLSGENGELGRCLINGRASGQAVIDDYAYVIWGLIELYEAGFDPKHLSAAIRLTEYANAHFIDPELGGYLEISNTAEDALFRPRSVYDGALPSGSTVMMMNQMRLASLTRSEEYARLAERHALPLATEANHSPQNCTMLLNALMFARFPAWEINVVGKPESEDTRNMLRLLSGAFNPFKSLRFYDAATINKSAGNDFAMVNDACTVYICRNQTCRAPVNSPAEAAKILNLKPLRNK